MARRDRHMEEVKFKRAMAATAAREPYHVTAKMSPDRFIGASFKTIKAASRWAVKKIGEGAKSAAISKNEKPIARYEWRHMTIHVERKGTKRARALKRFKRDPFK